MGHQEHFKRKVALVSFGSRSKTSRPAAAGSSDCSGSISASSTMTTTRRIENDGVIAHFGNALGIQETDGQVAGQLSERISICGSMSSAFA